VAQSSAQQLNSPLVLNITQDPVGVPQELKPYFTEIYNALFQLQLALVNYCGIASQPQSEWSQLPAASSVFAQNGYRTYLQCTETIATAAIVNVFNSGGVAKVRNANATNNTKPAHGFCNVSGGGVAGDFLEIIMFSGLCTLFAGLTPGQEYWLSTASGLIAAAPAVAAGNIEQFLGVALDSSSLFFNSHYRIQH
jgi:hypothetical protein